MDFYSGLEGLFGSSYIVTENSTMDAIKNTSSLSDREERSFYHLSIDELVRRVKLWRMKMPRVQPHYAVKCNNDPAVLKTLALLGTGFDCASRAEMGAILKLGVSPSRIIFAHPCKIASHVKYACNNGVKLMTFDSSQELFKVSKLFPEAELVIRIRCDAASAQCQLGMKFGVMPEEAQPLLALAAELGLKIVGVAFHVGSGCSEPQVFLRAIKSAKQVFMEAEAEGHNPTLLDLGGGFMGSKDSTLDEVSGYINAALDEHFPEGCGVRVIAEPGRYMVAAAFTLATPVINRRDMIQPEGNTAAMYFIDDGVYGSFNCILYDHQVVKPIPLKDEIDEETMESSIWGPTCDGFDLVIPSMQLPASLTLGDWFVWEDMGAYTLAAAGTFNGFSLPEVIVHMHSHTRVYLEDVLQTQISAKCSDEESSDRSSSMCSDDEMLTSDNSLSYASSDGSSSPGPHCNSLSSMLHKQLCLTAQRGDDRQHRAALVDDLFQDDKEADTQVTGFVEDFSLEECREM